MYGGGVSVSLLYNSRRLVPLRSTLVMEVPLVSHTATITKVLDPVAGLSTEYMSGLNIPITIREGRAQAPKSF